jgi:uncharacterized repeat protein (TIGR03803 family)
MDAVGNLYGIADSGERSQRGIVFELTADLSRPSGWAQTVLYTFCSQPNCADGANPDGNLVMDTAGNLYGTTSGGGNEVCGVFHKGGCGVVFELTPNAAKTEWTETVLYSFCRLPNCADGDGPEGGLIIDASGNLYGTTAFGGFTDNACVGSCGMVFALTPNASRTAWSETVLYRFCAQSGCPDGGNPQPGLVMDAAGNLYGTAGGGILDNGVVFALTPNSTGTAWTETVPYSFCSQPNCADGFEPLGLILDGAGNLYGTTSAGGTMNKGCGLLSCGVVFELTPTASRTAWSEAVLYRFCAQGGRCADGANPRAGLIMDAAGNFYGTTGPGGVNGSGTVFELAPNANRTAWTETVLHRFCRHSSCLDAHYSDAGVIMDAAGNLYGTGVDGGVSGGGVVFELVKSP